MRIVGTTDDTFNENGIDTELKVLVKKDETNKVKNKDDEDSTGEETKTENETAAKLSLAKYFLTFFQTWDRNSVPVNFCAARYALSTVDSKWLVKTQLEVIKS